MSESKYHIVFIVLLPGLIFAMSAFADDYSDPLHTNFYIDKSDAPIQLSHPTTCLDLNFQQRLT